MAQEREIINTALGFLTEQGVSGDFKESDEERVVNFVQDLKKGIFDPPPLGASSEQLEAYATQVEEQYDPQGEDITTIFNATCLLIAFLYVQSQNPAFLQDTIESIGKAGRNILDSKAGADLLKVLSKLKGG